MTDEELKDKIEEVCPLIDEIADAIFEKVHDDKTPKYRAIQLYVAYRKVIDARHELMGVDLHYLD